MMKYTISHEWIDIKETHAVVGISSFAQKELGTIVYVDLPSVGSEVKQDDPVVVLESSKAAIDIYSPASGTILSINEKVIDNPEIISTDPETEGWLFTISLSETPKDLIDKDAYKKMCDQERHKEDCCGET